MVADTPVNARDEILQRIRSSLADVPAEEQPEDVPVERRYRTIHWTRHETVVERFVEHVRDYRATVHLVPEEDVRRTIRTILRRRDVRCLAVSEDLPDAWLPHRIPMVHDEELSPQEIDEVDAVLTGCALGIAETGTIVLDGGPGQGRRILSLIPDYHLCVIRADQIVRLVSEGMARLHSAAQEGRPITFISGPSATSDIELNRVEGVHGPRTLEVIVIQ